MTISIKKMLLGLGGVALIASPIVFMVSCGKSNNPTGPNFNEDGSLESNVDINQKISGITDGTITLANFSEFFQVPTSQKIKDDEAKKIFHSVNNLIIDKTELKKEMWFGGPSSNVEVNMNLGFNSFKNKIELPQGYSVELGDHSILLLTSIGDNIYIVDSMGNFKNNQFSSAELKILNDKINYKYDGKEVSKGVQKEEIINQWKEVIGSELTSYRTFQELKLEELGMYPNGNLLTDSVQITADNKLLLLQSNTKEFWNIQNIPRHFLINNFDAITTYVDGWTLLDWTDLPQEIHSKIKLMIQEITAFNEKITYVITTETLNISKIDLPLKIDSINSTTAEEFNALATIEEKIAAIKLSTTDTTISNYGQYIETITATLVGTKWSFDITWNLMNEKSINSIKRFKSSQLAFLNFPPNLTFDATPAPSSEVLIK